MSQPTFQPHLLQNWNIHPVTRVLRPKSGAHMPFFTTLFGVCDPANIVPSTEMIGRLPQVRCPGSSDTTAAPRDL